MIHGTLLRHDTRRRRQVGTVMKNHAGGGKRRCIIVRFLKRKYLSFYGAFVLCVFLLFLCVMYGIDHDAEKKGCCTIIFCHPFLWIDFFRNGRVAFHSNHPLCGNQDTKQGQLDDRSSSASSSSQHLIDFTYGSILAPRNSRRAYETLDRVRFNSVMKFPSTDLSGLRVCIFTAEFGGIFPSGGIGYVLSDLAVLLASHNVSVTVAYLGSGQLIPEHTSAIQRLLDKKNISFINLPEPHIQLVPNHISLVGSYKALHFLRNGGKDQFDIVHFNDYLGHAIYPLYAKRQGWLLDKTQIVVCLHGTTMWSRLANKEYPQTTDDISVNWIEREAISSADFIWAPSKFIATSLISEGVVLPENVVVLKNAPPESNVVGKNAMISTTKTIRKSQIDDVNEITFFGRLETRKGPMLFVAALVELCKRYQDLLNHVKISFLGRDTAIDETRNSYRDEIHHIFQSIDSLMNVTVVFLEDLDRDKAISYISNRNRLIVIPSLTENLPGTVFECIEYRANFIAADVGGVREMIHREDIDDCLFKPLPSELARKIYQKMSPMDTEKATKLIRHAETPDMIRADIINFHQQIYKTPATKKRVLKRKMKPKITVCLTHFNRPMELLSTLQKWTSQAYKNFSLIVVDDESSEDVQVLLDSLVLPLIHEHEWSLKRIKHSYLGAARNRCVEAASLDTEFIFFTDDDDFISVDGLQSLVDIAQEVNADIVTSFFHQFHAPTLEEAVQNKTESIWMFSGGSLGMGITANYFGGALMLVKVKAFNKIGGFTELDMVGCEDWEFYMRATAFGLKVEVVPNEELLYIQKKNVSMSTTMDLNMCSYRAMSPILSMYPHLADSFLMLRGLLDSKAQKRKGAVQFSSTAYIGKQSSGGWEYGYCLHNPGTSVTALKCKFQHLPNFLQDQARYDMSSLTGFPWPFVGRFGMHPSISLLDGNQKSVTVLRRFTSNIVGEMTVHLYIKHSMPCGDGVLIQVFHNLIKIWGPTPIAPNSGPTRWNSEVTNINAGDKLLLMVSPNKNDQCDSISVNLDINVVEKIFL